MAAEAKMTMLLFFIFVFAFCSAPLSSNARILLEGKDIDSLTLFRKLGFELPVKDQMSLAHPLREAPGGPDLHHHSSPPPLKASGGLYKSLREAPSGPDPYHHSTPSFKASGDSTANPATLNH